MLKGLEGQVEEAKAEPAPSIHLHPSSTQQKRHTLHSRDPTDNKVEQWVADALPPVQKEPLEHENEYEGGGDSKGPEPMVGEYKSGAGGDGEKLSEVGHIEVYRTDAPSVGLKMGILGKKVGCSYMLYIPHCV